jgi:chromosome segregation ATPase
VLELRWEENGLPIPSQKFWTALCEEVSAVLAKASAKESDLTAQELARARAEMASAQDRMQQLQELNRQLCERAGISDLAQANVLRELASLERQQENLRSEAEAATARRTAIESEIARVGQAIDVKNDEIGAELRKIVQLREAQLERSKQLVASGQTPESELTGPQQALAEAKIQLLRHQEELRRAAGGEQLGRLTGELSGVTISQQEKQAVLGYVSKRLADMKAKNLPETADLYDREVAWQLPMARERAERARRQLEELEQQAGARRTTGVTLLNTN